MKHPYIPLVIKPLPAFNDNYIWLIVNTEEQSTIVVDPGDAQPVLQNLQETGLTLAAILITHHHADHCAGISQIMKHYHVPVYIPEQEIIEPYTYKVAAPDQFKQLGITFSVIDIPGHTRGHIAYYYPGTLFSGDTLFTGGCGRLFEGTAEQMVASLKKLCALPKDTLIYCGHEYTQANLRFALKVEPQNEALQQRIIKTNEYRSHGLPTVPASLELEQLTNPFLRCHIGAVITAAENYAGTILTSEVEVFKVLRKWKNSF